MVEDETPVEEVNTELNKMREDNDAMEEQLKRREILRTQSMLGGKSEAGEVPPPKKVETDIEYAERLNRGEANPLKEDGYI